MKQSHLWRAPPPFPTAVRLYWACLCLPMRAPAAVQKRCGFSTNFTDGEKPVTSRRPRFLTPTWDSVTRKKPLYGWSEPPKNDRTSCNFSKCIHSSIPCAATRVSQRFYTERTSNDPIIGNRGRLLPVAELDDWIYAQSRQAPPLQSWGAASSFRFAFV